jgi:hypothetical protein
VLKYTKATNQIQIGLDFKEPGHISMKFSDYVEVKICGSNYGPENCPTSKRKLPKMMSGA